MNFYFSSPELSALKIDGKLMPPSIWDKPTCLDLKAKPFIEYYPTQSPFSLHYYLSEDFLSCPPTNVEVCDLKGGYDICFIPPEQIMPFSVISQKKTDACFTIFCQHGYNLSVETTSDFFSMSLHKANNYQILPFYLDNKNLTAVTITTNKTQILVFDIENGKINLLLNQTANEVDIKTGLKIYKNHIDIAKHTEIISYGYKNSALFIKDKQIKTHPTFDRFTISEKLIPYAFLEEFLVDGDYSFYLSNEIKANQDKLAEYFGKFIGVIPPPRFRKQDQVGLIKKQKDNLYFIDYFCFEVNGSKIQNLFKI